MYPPVALSPISVHLMKGSPSKDYHLADCCFLYFFYLSPYDAVKPRPAPFLPEVPKYCMLAGEKVGSCSTLGDPPFFPSHS